MSVKAFRASLLHCLDDPGPRGCREAVEYFEDGLLVVENGRVAAIGEAADLLPGIGGEAELVDLGGKLITPGFVDCHVHFSQVDIVASYGEQLLDWLQRYAYPAEARFADIRHAEESAEFFIDALLQNGTTTALVFTTVHAQSVDAVLGAALQRNLRLIAGKVLMDRNCPPELRDTARSGYDESRALIEKWHGRQRIGYAITPRFALTSSDQQLAAAGRLAREFPGVHVHTHLAENAAEVESVAKLFPASRSYLDVYREHDLVRERSVFAHCLLLDDDDRRTLARQGASIAFCPSSNLFLGSGLFDLAAARDAGARVGIGSDVGGGTSLNVLRTLSDGYKVLQLQHQPLPAFTALYLATLGGAKALCLGDVIGNFSTGKEADFVVLDTQGDALTRRRLRHAEDVAERMFALMMLGDDRAVAATYVLGRPAWVA